MVGMESKERVRLRNSPNLALTLSLNLAHF